MISDNEVPGDAGDDQILCNLTSANLDARTGPGTWSTSSSGVTITDPSSPTSAVTNLNAGSNIFTWTVGADTDDVEIFVADVPPAPAISSSGSSVCGGTSVVLSVSNPIPDYTYEWYKDGNPQGGPFGDLILIGAAASGDYQLRATDKLTNCESELSAVETVSIEAPPDKPIVNASNNLGCDRDEITLTASEAPLNGSYVWFRGGVSISKNDQSIVIDSPAESGEYTVFVLSERGCTSSQSDPETITIEELPDTPSISIVSLGGDVICADGSQIVLESDLTPPDGGTYIWLRNGAEVAGEATQLLTLSSFDQSGDYAVRIVDGNGAMCISDPSNEENVEIFQLPSVAQVGNYQQLCEEATTTLEATIPTIGTGTWSTASPGITINDPNNPNSSVTGLSSGAQTFNWQVDNGACIGTPVGMVVEVFDAPSPAVTEDDKLICDEVSASISANVPANGTGEWEIVSGTAIIANNADPETTLTDLVPNSEVILSWTIRNGACIEETDEMRIQVGASPSPADAGSDRQLCNVTSARLSATSPVIGTGVWTVMAGNATLEDANDPETMANALVPGENVTLRWTVANECGSNTQDITIENELAPDVANAGADMELCSVTVTRLAGSGRGGLWTVVSGSGTFEDDSDPLSPVSDLSIGTNILKYSIAGNICDDTEDEVIITVYEEPDDAVAGNDLFFCNGETVADLTAQSPAIGTGKWTIVSGSGTILNNEQASTQIIDLQPGETILRWSVENGNCTANTDDLLIKVYPTPAVASDEVEICLGESIQLVAVGGDQYQWQPALGLDDASIANPVARPVESTLYTVDIISDNCINESLTVNVVVKPTPTLITIEDTTIFANEEIELFVSGAAVYQWTPGTGLDDPASSSPKASPSESTAYNVTGTNEFDCSATAQVTVSVNEGFQIFVPDLFSPNGDQMNDILYVNTLGIKDLDFRIFDRTGQEVFSTTSREDGWDGTFNGTEQSMDSYVYYVIAETIAGGKVNRKGSIQLVR